MAFLHPAQDLGPSIERRPSLPFSLVPDIARGEHMPGAAGPVRSAAAGGGVGVGLSALWTFIVPAGARVRSAERLSQLAGPHQAEFRGRSGRDSLSGAWIPIAGRFQPRRRPELLHRKNTRPGPCIAGRLRTLLRPHSAPQSGSLEIADDHDRPSCSSDALGGGLESFCHSMWSSRNEERNSAFLRISLACSLAWARTAFLSVVWA